MKGLHGRQGFPGVSRYVKFNPMKFTRRNTSDLPDKPDDTAESSTYMLALSSASLSSQITLLWVEEFGKFVSDRDSSLALQRVYRENTLAGMHHIDNVTM